jgi:hypothetical protein
MSIFGQKKSITWAILLGLVFTFAAFWLLAVSQQSPEGGGPAALDWLAVGQAASLSALILMGSGFLAVMVERTWFGAVYEYLVSHQLQRDMNQTHEPAQSQARFRVVVNMSVRCLLFVVCVVVVSNFN